LAIDLSKLRQEVDATGSDLTKPSSGGGDFAPPAEGPTRLRLVSYIETGVHKTMFKGAPKVKPRSELTFELSGPKHEPRKLDDGTLIPFRITVKEVVGTTARNGYIKLFNLLNTEGKAKNFLGLLIDGAWRGNVSHYKFKSHDGSDRVVAQLKKDGAYQISPVSFEDPESGELRTVSVPPAITEPRVFLWDYPDLEQWDSLYIDGTRDDGTSKNYIQEKIKSAENFVGSPIYNLLIESGRADEAEPIQGAADEDEEGDEKPAAQSLETAAPAPAPAPAKPAAAKPAAAAKAPAKPAAPKAKPVAAKPAAKPAAPEGDPLQGL
jgi:hypothetical protein